MEADQRVASGMNNTIFIGPLLRQDCLCVGFVERTTHRECYASAFRLLEGWMIYHALHTELLL